MCYIEVDGDRPPHAEVAMLPPRKDRGQRGLLYCFNPESLIPNDYILREIDRLIDFRPIRKKLAKFYTWFSQTVGGSGSDVLDLSAGLFVWTKREPIVSRAEDAPGVPVVLQIQPGRSCTRPDDSEQTAESSVGPKWYCAGVSAPGD